MELVSIEEVNLFCEEQGIPINWHRTKEGILGATLKIMDYLELSEDIVSVETLAKGIEVELEHGLMFPEFNITNNHPIFTAKIALVHLLKESKLYYAGLEKMEKTLEKEEAFLGLEKALETRNIKIVMAAIESFEKKYEEE